MTEMLVGALIGAVVGWAIARYYYVRSTADLKEQFGEVNARLDKLVALLENGEQAGVAKLERDASGAVVGGVIIVPPTGQLSLVGHAPTVTVSGTKSGE